MFNWLKRLFDNTEKRLAIKIQKYTTGMEE